MASGGEHGRASGFKAEAAVFLDHVAALLVPGRKVKAHDVLGEGVVSIGNLAGWQEAEYDILIEEGRRTLDRQAVDFDRVRTTAQVLLPTATALLVIVGTELERVLALPGSSFVRWPMYLLWPAATALVLLGALGAAAVLSVRAPFGAIWPPLVSQIGSPVKRTLAQEYAAQAATGEITNGTRITVIRDAISLFALGGIAYAALWILRVVLR